MLCYSDSDGGSIVRCMEFAPGHDLLMDTYCGLISTPANEVQWDILKFLSRNSTWEEPDQQRNISKYQLEEL